MTHLLLLSLLALPPDAALHHDRAIAHHEAGRLDEAIDEFVAAYAALPDPRADRDDREQLLGSLHGLLLQQHEVSGVARPLCRLDVLLRIHLEALAEAHPDEPDRRELVVNRERRAALASRLAQLPADACAPAPARVAAPVEAAATDTPALETAAAPPPPREAPPRPRRGLRVGGGLALGVGAALLGVMTFGLVEQRRRRDEARALELEIGDPISRAEYDTLLTLRGRARSARLLAAFTGLGAAASLTVGVALLVVDQRARRGAARPVALAPWWLSSGAGLTATIRLP